VRWVDSKPQEDAQQLNGDEREGDDQLGGRGDEARRCHRLLALLEDAVDAVGLGEQRSIAEAHAEAQEDAAEGADDDIRGCDHGEGDDVAQEDTCQKHVAHFPPRGTHDGGVVVADEGDDDKGGGNDAQDRDEDGHQGPG